MEELINARSTVITYTDYSQYKAELDAELEKSAESFIRIGYLLKVARDTGILRDSGYSSVNEFAEKEYGLDKTQVSRFMRINDRFSEDGYSEVLKTEYKGFGYAKLALMLQLPDTINEELTPDYSKSEIQAIKDEIDDEKQVTDLEVMLEEKDERQQALDETLQQVAYQIGKEDSGLYVALWESWANGENEEAFIEQLAPSGTKTYSVRIPGTGRMMLLIKEAEEEVKLINVRDAADKRSYTRQELVNAWGSIFTPGDAKTSWSSTYGEPFPEEEVVPVQPKTAPRKESKVVKAKPPKPEKKKSEKTTEALAVQASQEEPSEAKEMTLHDIEAEIPEPDPAPEEAQNEERQDTDTEKTTDTAEEEQLPGQQEITEYPEVIPAETEQGETGTDVPEPGKEPEPMKSEEQQVSGQDSVKDHPEQEETQEELQLRAYQIVTMSLSASMGIWKDKKMPLEAIQRNKDNAQRVVELLEKMEELAKQNRTEGSTHAGSI